MNLTGGMNNVTNEIINSETCDEVIRLLRVQRHDFINHLQVIHGLLQLGRTERAVIYIEELAKNPDLISKLLGDHARSETCKIDHL